MLGLKLNHISKSGPRNEIALLTMHDRLIDIHHNIDGLVQDCGNSSALAIDKLQSYTKPSIGYIPGMHHNIRQFWKL